MTTLEVYAADRLYLYLSADGVTRQRCGRHVHKEGWGKPKQIWLIQRPGKRHTCIECFYERFGISEEQEHENSSEPIV
jgi:hypothetical protein